MKQIFSHSLRLSFMFYMMGVGILPTLIIVACLLLYYPSHMTNQEANGMKAQATLLSGEILTSGYLENTEMETLNAELSATADAYAGRIMIMNSSLKIIKDTYGMYEGRTFLWDNVVKAAAGEENYVYDEDHSCLILATPITQTRAGSKSYNTADEEPLYDGVILMTESTSTLEENLDFLYSFGLIGGLAAIIFAVTTSIIISRYLVRPMRKVAASIDEIDKSKQGMIFVDDYTETEEISESFNRYYERMQKVDESRNEFVSNVSHELKTPLTSMKVLADSINSMGGEAPLEMYREFMGDITTEIDRETKIINDLLSLVRMDKSKADLNISAVNINELLELLLKRLEPIAQKQKVDLVLESFRPVSAEVDEVKFTLAIMNLIENAIKYNNEGGWVHISINSSHQYFFVRVEDNGLGIPEEDLDHVFDRFFRADKSHSREISGTGLGLAITKDAILLHHGEIRVASTLGEGTTFDVRIPLSYISEDSKNDI